MFLLKSIILEINDNAKETEKNEFKYISLTEVMKKRKEVESDLF